MHHQNRQVLSIGLASQESKVHPDRRQPPLGFYGIIARLFPSFVSVRKSPGSNAELASRMIINVSFPFVSVELSTRHTCWSTGRPVELISGWPPPSPQPPSWFRRLRVSRWFLPVLLSAFGHFLRSVFLHLIPISLGHVRDITAVAIEKRFLRIPTDFAARAIALLSSDLP